MALAGRTKCALLLGVSVVVLGVVSAQVARAQAVETVQAVKPKKKRAATPQAVFPEPVRNANAQIGRQTTQALDEITVTASKSPERAIDALAPVSVMTLQQIQGRQASTVGALVYNMPGVWLQDRGDEPSTSINIRGLQDFGRVAVVVDGARQNYQRTGHFANGSFFLNPELIGGIDITRGPTANIYGSGAIGGVASFRTKDIQDVLRPGETWGVDVNSMFGSNTARAMSSAFGGVRINPNVDFFAGGTYSTQENYRDGSGVTVSNTGNKLSSGLAKLTVRPADGHEVKLGTVFQEDLYSVGQPARPAGLPNSAGGALSTGTSVYATNVKNYTTTLGWTYSQPDDKLIDWDAKIYWNRTENDQTKISHNGVFSAVPTPFPSNCTPLRVAGNNITGCIGDQRSYRIDTFGFDVHNTSRFEFGDWRNAITYGGDGFRDDVSTADQNGNSNVTTPGGQRTVTGAFVQWKGNYTSLLEVVGALRYDSYELSSARNSTSGDRLSPKITIGFLPTSIVTPYLSYAEGYRAPSITESLISGGHTATSIGAGDTARCADGSRGYFCFIPNTGLRPEVGKNKEIGINLKKNDLIVAGDGLRGKFNLYQNDVEDYIDYNLFTCPPGSGNTGLCYQYQNITGGARIRGFEAEVMYDANSWFVGVSGSAQEGKRVQTGVGLLNIPSQKITTTAGVRLLDNTVILSGMWTNVKANTDLPAGTIPATSYNLVNLYATVRPTKDISVQFSVENLLNQYYRPYAIPGPDPGTGLAQNDVLWASAGSGIVFKGGLKYHFGG